MQTTVPWVYSDNWFKFEFWKNARLPWPTFWSPYSPLFTRPTPLVFIRPLFTRPTQRREQASSLILLALCSYESARETPATKEGNGVKELIEIRNRNQRFVSTRSSRSSIVALSVRNGRRSGLGLWQSGSQDEGSSYFSQLFSRELKTSYVSLPALSPINRPGDGTLNVQEKSQRSGLLSEMFQPPSK